MDYYDENARGYSSSTVNVNMQELYDLVLPYLKPQAKILDLGCGSGRDAKRFREMGYDVLAADPSEAMCELAQTNSGVEVVRLSAEEMDYKDRFDLIWACASLLHIRSGEMPKVWHKIHRALAQGGIVFVSVKKGDFEGLRGGRWFCDYTLDKLAKTGYQDAGLNLIYSGESLDKRPGRETEVWLNVILKKGV